MVDLRDPTVDVARLIYSSKPPAERRVGVRGTVNDMDATAMRHPTYLTAIVHG